uniref:Basic helix-loop-helix family member e41 n=1 Tax=Pelusios castaneus TaxID=367368 RepID=A0A8C8SYD7_9SAUR
MCTVLLKDLQRLSAFHRFNQKKQPKNQLLSNMDEGIPRLQERQLLEHGDFIGLDYPSLYLCKPKRGMKRDESKETYKLPHRLIEKKRRDRINECIAQLKDLLPEHLKLTTLGHLEKAVVLELTLKHLKALTALTEQQHQNIIALQNGERSMKSPIQCDLDAFHSGFQTCAKEVLQYLSRFESWTPREQRCAQLVNHLHAVSTQFLPSPQLLAPQVAGSKGPSSAPDCGGRQPQTNCVPVIQRTQPAAELGGENDTDTDSGYGGESEARPEREKGPGVTIKQEPAGDEEAPAAPKRPKLDCSSAAALSPDPAALLRPDAALLSSLLAFGGGGAAFGQQAAAPFCLPFYFISPSAAYMQPLLDKSGLEKYLYPAAAPLPLLYPGIPAQAAAAFPCLSSVLAPADKASGAAAAAALLSLDGLSPVPHLPRPFAQAGRGPLDSDGPSAQEEILQRGQESP